METKGKLKPWLLVTWLASVRARIEAWSLWVSRDLVISLSRLPARCVWQPARDLCPREDETHKKRLSSLDRAGQGRCWTTQHLFKWLPTPRLQALSPRSGVTPTRLPFKGKETHHLSRWYLGWEALWELRKYMGKIKRLATRLYPCPACNASITGSSFPPHG